MEYKISVDIKGPLFDDNAANVVAMVAEDLRHDISYEAVSYLYRLADENFKYTHPAYKSGRRTPGGWKSAVTVVNKSDTDLVTDQEIVYGRWLESGGSGKFKGYQLWAKTKVWTDTATEKLVSDAETRISKLLGGGSA